MSGCITFNGQVDKDGYGLLRVDGVTRRAPRAYWEFVRGAIPAGLHVLHSCDNPRCVNLAHLRLGTHAENMAEMAAKKRSHRPVGEKNGRAKLTYAAVLEMRQLYAQGGITQAALAKRYGVPRGTVCHALSGYTWQR